MATVHEIVCDQCGKRKPAAREINMSTLAPEYTGRPHGWVVMAPSGNPTGPVTDVADLCSWECAAAFAQRMADRPPTRSPALVWSGSVSGENR